MNYTKYISADGTHKILKSCNGVEQYVDDDHNELLDWLAQGNEMTEIVLPAPTPESLEACIARLISELSQDSFNAKDLLVPAYREDNAIRHKLATGEEMYTEYSLAQIDQLSVDCRAEFYRVKGLIESATTTEDAETAYNSKNFPITL